MEENFENKVNEGVKNAMNTEDSTSQFSQQDIAQNKLMAVLSYLSLLWLIPFFTTKDKSPYVKYHVNQGLTLLILSIILNVVTFILGFIPVVGAIISWVVYLVQLVFTILGIVNAVQGKAKQLPIIGGITLLK